jgi:hypothetical protein
VLGKKGKANQLQSATFKQESATGGGSEYV